jgi:hypothetical protein
LPLASSPHCRPTTLEAGMEITCPERGEIGK